MKYIRWTNDKVRYLIENYKEKTALELAQELGGTKWGIQKKLRRIGIKKGHDFTTLQTRTRRLKSINNIKVKLFNNLDIKELGFAHFICGFVAGEGTFTKHITNKKTGTISFTFRISLADDDHTILEEIKNFFNIGNIQDYPPRKDGWKGQSSYYISSIPKLVNIIIPFFDKFGFYSARKQKQYDIWKDVLTNYYKDKWIASVS